MNNENQATSPEKNPNNNDKLLLNQVKDLFGINFFKELVTTIIDYSRDNFEKFSALFIAVITTGIWLIRALGYCYQSGSLSVYNISKSYIEIDNNFFYQFIQVIAVLVILFITNFILTFLLLKPDQSKFHYKRKIKIILIFIFEMIVVFSIVLISSNTSLISLIKDIKGSSSISNLLTFTVLFFILLFFTVAINLFGIVIAFNQKKFKQNSAADTTSHNNSSNESIIALLITFLIVISILLPCSYIYGKVEENKRTTYKIIEEPLDSTDSTDKKFIFTSPENNSYKLSAIIYENKDIYILARLYKEDDKIILDKSYQKVIDKDDIITYTYDNIYNITT